MDIIINSTAEEELKLKKKVLQAYSRKNYIVAIIFVIAGLAFLFDEYKVMGEQLPFWNLLSAIGLSLIFLGLYTIFSIVYQRSSILAKPTLNTTTNINDECVSIKNRDSEITFKWSYFNFYSINNSFLCLRKDLTLSQAVIIDRKSLNETQLFELQKIITTKGLTKRV